MGFDELREQNRAAAMKLSRAEALARIAAAPHLAHPAAASTSAALLALARSPQPLSSSDRARCDALHQQIVREAQLLVRPGTVEDLWFFDGLLDRLMQR